MIQRIKYALAAALLCLPLSMWAGEDDSFGGWFEVELSKKLNKKTSIDLGVEGRTGEKARAAFSVGASYKPFKFIKFSTGYSFIDKYKDSKREEHYKKDIVDPDNWNGFDLRPSYWRISHRAFADVTGSIKLFSLLRISVRERYQFSYNTSKTIDEEEFRYNKVFNPETGQEEYALKEGYPIIDPKVKEGTPDHVLRSRVKVEFSKKALFFTPFVTAEAHNSLSNSMTLEKMRYSAGVEFKCVKWFSVNAAYVFTKEYHDDMAADMTTINKRIHALSVGCNFDF